MLNKKKYPRVLIVAIGRINASDFNNNGLLLRNLFCGWPSENLAQIYSSGDNGDDGFFGSYYCLGREDRLFGDVFYKVKGGDLLESDKGAVLGSYDSFDTDKGNKIKKIIKHILVDTGLYENIFVPRISKDMRIWIGGFNPDVILMQGYNLTFVWLPLLIKKRMDVKLSIFATDDWPTYLYSGLLGESTIFSWLVRRIVNKTVNKLFCEVDIPFAFGQPMADEYTERYKKSFYVLNHSDSIDRFDECREIRIHSDGVITIIAVGGYNKYRWPLLLDFNESCKSLNDEGIKVRLAVFASNIDSDGKKALSKSEFVDLYSDPGHERLPSYLKGADILLLVEGFDDGFVSAIKLSVSSKAHLFMMSQRPIIVYSHRDTGVARYANKMGWAKVISVRNIADITVAIKSMLQNKGEVDGYIKKANEVILKYHTEEKNRSVLSKVLSCN